MGNGTRRHDDVDDFMANILGSGASSSQKTPHNPAKTPRPKQRPERAAPRPASKDDGNIFRSIDMEERKPTKKRRSTPRPSLNISKKLLFIPLVALLAIGGFFLWKGPISSLLQPSSPFSKEVQQSAGITLYFPSKPPTGFKIEIGTITQPEKGVVMFAMTTDDGKRIVMNQQQKPENISLDPLYAVLKDVKPVQTKYGEVKIGTSEDGITVANVVIENTWIIINSSDGSLNTESLKTIVDGLKT